jgi:hypothetical protein
MEDESTCNISHSCKTKRTRERQMQQTWMQSSCSSWRPTKTARPDTALDQASAQRYCPVFCCCLCVRCGRHSEEAIHLSNLDAVNVRAVGRRVAHFHAQHLTKPRQHVERPPTPLHLSSARTNGVQRAVVHGNVAGLEDKVAICINRQKPWSESAQSSFTSGSVPSSSRRPTSVPYTVLQHM